LTAEHGRHGGLVRGAFGRSKRGVLQPGNEVELTWRARIPEHLGSFEVELKKSWAAHILDDARRLAALNAACAVAETALPEREAHAPVYEGFLVLLSALADGDSWPQVYVRWELGVLSELGFGLSLDRCAASGVREDLVYVSPKSGRAVSAEAGEPYRDRLLRLPPFLAGERGGAAARDPHNDISAGFELCGFFLDRHVFAHRRGGEPKARSRLADIFLSQNR
jgi:DNA repair protein RecO (recombination protein O)